MLVRVVTLYSTFDKFIISRRMEMQKEKAWNLLAINVEINADVGVGSTNHYKCLKQGYNE